MSPSNPKPDHSTHGQVYDPANTHNTWIKDTKTKTARCRLCSDKVDVYSWQASCCAKRICSKCCEGDASKTDFQKQTAQDQLRKGCWCRFPSGFNPKFKGLQDKVPVKQTEQLAKVRLGIPGDWAGEFRCVLTLFASRTRRPSRRPSRRVGGTRRRLVRATMMPAQLLQSRLQSAHARLGRSLSTRVA